MNSNEAYLKKGKEVTDFLTWKLLYPILLIIYIIVNPISIFIISLLISFLILRPNLKLKKAWKRFLYLCLIIHIFLISTYSISPYLQYQEFRFSHWNWEKVEGKPENFHVKWEEVYRRKSPKAIADIQYSFQLNDEIKKATEFDALKIYYPYFAGKTDEKKEELKRELSQQIKQHIANKDDVILANTKNGKSKLFITTEKVLLANSGAYNFITNVGQVFLGIALLIFIGWLIVRYFLKDK